MHYKLVASLAILVCLICTSCTARNAPGSVRSTLPRAGTVTVLYTVISNTSKSFHTKWSLVGDRNWRTVGVTQSLFTLSETSKLNSAEARGGCFTWELDVKSSCNAQGVWLTQVEMRGSNGKTARLNNLPGKSVPLLTADSVQRVGETVIVASVASAKLSIATRQ